MARIINYFNMANQHVVKRPNGTWAVKGEGNFKDTSRHDTQSDAFEKAKDIAENQGGDVFIHGLDGKFRERNTYGKKDYCPPKG